jgi:hypothetical protein
MKPWGGPGLLESDAVFAPIAGSLFRIPFEMIPKILGHCVGRRCFVSGSGVPKKAAAHGREAQLR